MLNRMSRCRTALSLSVLLLTSFAPALPFASAQQAPPAPTQSPAEKAATDELGRINKDGFAAYGRGDFPAALKTFQTGLDKAQTLQNEKYMANFLNNLGIVSNGLGQSEKALAYLQRALTLWEKIGAPAGVAAGLNSLGVVYSTLGRNEKALDYYSRALTLREKIGVPADIASSLNRVGDAYTSMGQNERALEYLQRALTLREKVGNPTAIGQSLNSLGIVYSALGRNEKARDYFQQALTLREKGGDLSDIAASLANLGNAYADLDQKEKALDCYQRAMTLFEKIGDPATIANGLGNIGILYWSLGQNEKALAYEQRGLTLQETIGNPQDIASSLNNIGAVYGDLGQHEKSLDYQKRALALYEKAGNPATIAVGFYNLGNEHAEQKRAAMAEDAYSRARTVFETLNRQIDDPTQLAALQQKLPHLYEQFACVRAQQKRPAEALALLEAGRARGIARQFFLNRSGFSKALTPEESANLKVRLSDMNAANNSLSTASQRLASSPADQRALLQRSRDEEADKARNAERKYDAYNAELFQRYPQFRSESGDITITAKDLRSLAEKNPDTLFLTWALLDWKQTDLYALGRRENGTIRNFTVSVGAKKWGEMAAKWRIAIQDEAKDEPQQAKALYTALFSPLEKAGLLAKGRYKRLVVVPSGPLLELPFAALMDHSGRRLIENYAVSSKVALSASFWRSNPVASKSAILCVADPIGTAPAKDEQVALRRAGFGPLPGARREGEAVAGLFHTDALVGAQAKKADVLRAMPDAKLLHFATHGYLNRKNPFYSGLVLAPEPAGGSDDGVLSAREILNLSLAAKLTVLSACETGRGVARGGDGLQGLVWAFQAAGCPCVAASQWQVDDAATRELMLAFYRNLKAGQRKDDALRNAMLAVKNEKPEPFFWAAFELVGDTSPL